MADAAYAILSKNSRDCTGNFFIDEDVLRQAGMTDFSKYDCVPGAPLSPDFFIPDGKYQDEFIQNDKRKKSQDSMKSVVSEADIQQVLERSKPFINDEVIGKLKAVYLFKLTGDKERYVVLDVKSSPGGIRMVQNPIEGANCTMTLALEDFLPLFTGKLSAQSAFLTKKLKIQGEIDKALKLEGFLKQVNKASKI